MPPALLRAYDAEFFRSEGHAVVELLADYLARANAGLGHVLPWLSPEDQKNAWPADFNDALDPQRSRTANNDLTAIVKRVLEASHCLHHPRYVGHQVAPPLPVSALLDGVAAFLNNGMAIYEMGPVSTAMERNLVTWLCERLGYKTGDGIFTSGGSSGNLTALLAARQTKAGWDVWKHGLAAHEPTSVFSSTQAHYSVARAAAIMGCGTDAVIRVAVDERFRMCPNSLDNAIAASTAAGRRSLAVVVSAGSTATGSIDPIDRVADVCEKHDVWLHVDGAHGASLALSEPHKSRLQGIERADSVVWDMHKMMLMPALATAVLFREPRRSYAAFAQEATYLFDGKAPEDEWMNGAIRTLECTKRMMSLKLFVCLKLYGAKTFGDYVDHVLSLARTFAQLLNEASDFELAVPPELNIVCFRYVPRSGEGEAHLTPPELDALQARVRRAIVTSGRFYLVQTELPSGLWLRTALMNPRTRQEDLVALLDEIRTRARATQEAVSAS